jgi:hypothetical protein
MALPINPGLFSGKVKEDLIPGKEIRLKAKTS